MYDTSWARRPLARAVREVVFRGALGPITRWWTRPRITGLRQLAGVPHPVLFVANHSSHLDTYMVLGRLPRRWRVRTVVLAAADYFYRNKASAFAVSLLIGTIPVERRELSDESREYLNQLLVDGWSLLLFPEGTRTPTLELQPLRSGAAYLAVKHQIPLVPIGITGTNEALPPGAPWPRHHDVTLRVGAPLQPGDDHRELNGRLTAALAELVG